MAVLQAKCRQSIHIARQALKAAEQSEARLLSASGAVLDRQSREASTLTAKGAGGRSSVSGVVATVFGATGFLGRYVVQQLARVGSQVIVPYRGEYDSQRHLKLMGDLGQVVPMPFSLANEASIEAAIAKSNVVVNLLGRDNETRNFSFQDLNVEAAATIAKLAAKHGSSRLIHVSCLGASPQAPALSWRTKAAGEAAVKSQFPTATILRPGPMVGTEDRLLNFWAMTAKKLGCVPVVGGGLNRVQPVHVLDAGAAVLAALYDATTAGRTFELGGPDVFTVRELVDLVYAHIREPERIIDVPLPLAKLIAAPLSVLSRLPLPLPQTTFTSDYVDTQTVDCVVAANALSLADLGIEPRKLEGVTIDFLHAYRAGGPSLGKTVGERVTGAGF